MEGAPHQRCRSRPLSQQQKQVGKQRAAKPTGRALRKLMHNRKLLLEQRLAKEGVQVLLQGLCLLQFKSRRGPQGPNTTPRT